MSFFKGNPARFKNDEYKVAFEKYMDYLFTSAYSSLHETALANNLNSGFLVTRLNAYQLELLFRAKGTIQIENDPLKNDDYQKALEEEKKRIKGEDEGNESQNSSMMLVRLASFKLAYFLKKFEEGKTKKDAMSA